MEVTKFKIWDTMPLTKYCIFSLQVQEFSKSIAQNSPCHLQDKRLVTNFIQFFKIFLREVDTGKYKRLGNTALLCTGGRGCALVEMFWRLKAAILPFSPLPSSPRGLALWCTHITRLVISAESHQIKIFYNLFQVCYIGSYLVQTCVIVAFMLFSLFPSPHRPSITEWVEVDTFKLVSLSTFLPSPKLETRALVCDIYSISQGPGGNQMAYSNAVIEESFIRHYSTAVWTSQHAMECISWKEQQSRGARGRTATAAQQRSSSCRSSWQALWLSVERRSQSRMIRSGEIREIKTPTSCFFSSSLLAVPSISRNQPKPGQGDPVTRPTEGQPPGGDTEEDGRWTSGENGKHLPHLPFLYPVANVFSNLFIHFW